MKLQAVLPQEVCMESSGSLRKEEWKMKRGEEIDPDQILDTRCSIPCPRGTTAPYIGGGSLGYSQTWIHGFPRKPGNPSAPTEGRQRSPASRQGRSLASLLLRIANCGLPLWARSHCADCRHDTPLYTLCAERRPSSSGQDATVPTVDMTHYPARPRGWQRLILSSTSDHLRRTWHLRCTLHLWRTIGTLQQALRQAPAGTTIGSFLREPTEGNRPWDLQPSTPDHGQAPMHAGTWPNLGWFGLEPTLGPPSAPSAR